VATQATTTRRPVDRARRREELLDAADRVVRRGGIAASMDEIALEAGITKPVLYRHFGDKDGLYTALAERYVAEIARALRPREGTKGARARFAAGVDAYLSYVEREPERYRFVLGAAERPGASRIVADFRRGQVADCAFATGENLRGAGLDPELAEPWAHCVSAMVRAAGAWWVESGPIPRERLVEHLTTLVWEGVSALRRPAADRPA
jgi:AcrR family transcriptional regulator